MKKGKEQYEETFYYVTKTQKAICVTTDLDAGDEVWLPIFDKWGNEQVTFEIKGNKVTIFAPEDLLTEKGLV